MKTLTVKQLADSLAKLPPDLEVRVWLPGSTITLGAAFASNRGGKAQALIEGNVDEGSALELAIRGAP